MSESNLRTLLFRIPFQTVYNFFFQIISISFHFMLTFLKKKITNSDVEIARDSYVINCRHSSD